jgi:hypothetical protein
MYLVLRIFQNQIKHQDFKPMTIIAKYHDVFLLIHQQVLKEHNNYAKRKNTLDDYR